jgi:maleylpyruvate isomerase
MPNGTVSAVTGWDAAEVQRSIQAAAASQAALVAWLGELDPVESSTPSRLPGWSIGHVLTHLARNADSHRSMLAGLPQYPGGPQQRDGDIEAGAAREWGALIDDVAVACAALEAEWAQRTDWSGVANRGAGTRPIARLPELRQREVEVHRTDLGLGYTFDDLPREFVRRQLAAMEMLWRASKPMGMTALPKPALSAAPPLRLAWLLGRAEIEGLAPAGVF